MTLPDWMKERGQQAPLACAGVKTGFVDKSLKSFASVLKKAFAAESFSSRDALLQRLEPRAKLAGFFFLILGAALSRSLVFISVIIAFTFCLSMMTKVGVAPLVRRVLPATVFTVVLAAPAVFGFVTPGSVLVEAAGLTITSEGVSTALFFVLRVSSMAALASLATLTTTQSDFFRGLGRLLPSFFVTALFFTFRYALILVKTAEEAALARKSRTICGSGVTEAQRWSASRAAFLLKRSLNMADEVSMAMASRGFDGHVRLNPASPLGRGEFLWLGAASFFLFLSFGF